MCLEKNFKNFKNFQETAIKEANSQKLLWATIDHKLNFEKHIKTFFKTAGKKTE